MSYWHFEKNEHLYFKKSFQDNNINGTAVIAIKKDTNYWWIYCDFQHKKVFCSIDEIGNIIAGDNIDLSTEKLNKVFHSLFQQIKKIPKYKLKLVTAPRTPAGVYYIWNEKVSV